MLRALREPLPRWGRVLRAGLLLVGALLTIALVTAPMREMEQAALTAVGVVVFLIVNRSRHRTATLFLVLLSLMATFRYLFWRASDTLALDSPLQGLLSLGLLAAEGYAGMLLLLSYMQMAYPLNRKPVPLPRDVSKWPTVDVYIPTYNEALDIVRPTVLAALNIDWPRDKLNIYILDDGRRAEFGEFAEHCGCGYIIRPNNKGAKAGNINHALQHTDGELIVIFDCDHAPTRAFLQMTVGWLLRDRTLAMVQTPHYFYSPDPFERNLAAGKPVPNEGLVFYGRIQQGNDLWNATFFCGSCAVMRRAALEQVGGVPEATVTEDCHCSFLMQQRGWGTAYLRLPLAAGLATERLGLHVGQRLRWARGMIQILRLEWTPVAAGLTLLQRACYFTASFSFLFAIPRLVFLTAPLAYLLLGQNIIAASPLAIVAYAGSHMFHTFGTSARLNGRNRHSFWSEVYETVMALPLLPVTLLTLWNPTKGKFNVTAKGGVLKKGYFDLRVVWPTLLLLGLLLLGLGFGLHGIATTDGLKFQAYLLNTIWCALCLVPVSASVAVGRERAQLRERARVEARLPAEIVFPNGLSVLAESRDLSLSGARLATQAIPPDVGSGSVALVFQTCGDRIEIPATLLRWEAEDAVLRFEADDLKAELAIARLVLGRPDAWVNWDAWPEDRPLRSLRALISCTVAAVFRGYRFRKAAPGSAVPAPARATAVVRPRYAERTSSALKGAATVLACVLLASAASAQPTVNTGMLFTGLAGPAPPAGPAAGPAPVPAVAASPVPAPSEPTEEVQYTLRELGLKGPMQLRGISDLQGILFGMRSNEVVTSARLSISGAASPALLQSLSQIAITLNDQPVGAISIDPALHEFGPVEINLDPLFFTDTNRINFRFAGRYAPDCNDPLSGLLWATISDLSTLTLQIAHLPQSRDLARLPEPFFYKRITNGKLMMPFVLPETLGTSGMRAAAIAASWFAVQADYRGASFPVSRAVPPKGHAVVFSVAGESPPGVNLPRMDGPGLALVANPLDKNGVLLVIGGRTEAEVVTAAAALATSHGGFTGEQILVNAPQLPKREPYVAPNWLPPDRPVSIAQLVDRSELQGYGYTPATIRVPVRTPPDLYTWRNSGIPVNIHYRSPPGPVVDVSASRLDLSVSDTFLRSYSLADDRGSVLNWLTRQLGLQGDQLTARLSIPPYLLLGRDELQMRFDMRPLARSECVGTPGEIRTSVDGDSTVDISHAWRYARLPNLGFFASSGFPFTKFADLSGSAAVLPERPTTVESGAFLDLIGFLSAITGAPATGLGVVTSASMISMADRDLLVIGALSDSPALTTLLRDGPLQVENRRLTLALPDALQDIRALLLGAPRHAELTRASLALNGAGEGLGLIIGRESSLMAGRSVVGVTGMTPAAVANAVAVVQEPQAGARVKGDLTLVQPGQITAFVTSDGYDVGSLPFWLWPQRWLGDRPDRASMVMLVAAGLIAPTLYWLLRRRAAMRLRARSAK